MNHPLDGLVHHLDPKLSELLKDKSICYVCPAPVDEPGYIDSYDLVVRVGVIQPPVISDNSKYGTRTDIIISGGSKYYYDEYAKMEQINPDRFQDLKCIINARSNMEWDCYDYDCNEYISKIINYKVPIYNDTPFYHSVEDRYPSTQTGLHGLIYLLQYPIKEIYVTGMNFYNFGRYHLAPVYTSGYVNRTTMPNGLPLDCGHIQSDQIRLFKSLLNYYPQIKLDKLLSDYFRNN